MKNYTSLMATAIYCGFTSAAAAMLLTGAPADPLDPGFASLGDLIADGGAKMNFLTNSETAIVSDGAATPKPGILGLMGVSLVGFSVARRQHKVNFLDAGAALGLLIYLAPLFAMATALVRLCGPGSLFQRCETITSEGRRVWLLRLRTAPASNARRWQRCVLNFLQMTRADQIPVLVNVLRGDIDLRTAVNGA